MRLPHEPPHGEQGRTPVTTVNLAATMVAPSIDYRALSPMLIVLGAAVVAVLVEAFVPQRWRSRTQLVLALIGLVAALVAVVALAASGNDRTTMSGAVVLDGPTLFSQGVIVVVAVLTVLICSERRLDNVLGAGRPRVVGPHVGGRR